MCSLKIVVAFFVAVVAISEAKLVTVRNARSTNIVLNVDGTETTVLAGQAAALILADNAVSSITALPSDAEVKDGPKTQIEFTLGTTDSYVVSLANGFNVGAKIIPQGSANCASSICAANLLVRCPAANQVTNSLGGVEACSNSPLLMAAVCPLAKVSDTDVITTQSCASAISYLVLIN